MGTKPPFEDQSITCGICSRCYRSMLNQMIIDRLATREEAEASAQILEREEGRRQPRLL
jgi:hypothetical protein